MEVGQVHVSSSSEDAIQELEDAFLFDTESQITLRFRTWFIISTHFVTRGLEFHHQLKWDYFVFKTDENGDEYITLSHETKLKNWQGGIDSTEIP